MIKTMTLITCDRCKETNQQEIKAENPPRFFYETGAKFDLCEKCRGEFMAFMAGKPLEVEKAVIAVEENTEMGIVVFLSDEELDRLGDVDDSQMITLNPNIYARLYAEAKSARKIRGIVFNAWETLAGYANEELSIVECLQKVEILTMTILPDYVSKPAKVWLSDRVQALKASDTIPSEPAPQDETAPIQNPGTGNGDMPAYQRSPGLPYIR